MTETILQDIAGKLDKIIGLLSGGAVNALPLAPVLQQTTQSLYAWLEEWYETYKTPKLKPSSLLQIRNIIDKHIKGNFEDKPLVQITALDVQKTVNKVQSSRMRKYTYDTLGACLKQAYKLDMIPDVMTKTDGVTHQRKTGNALTVETQERFLSAVHGNKLEKLYKFYLLSGCRKSEALSLRWTDIDFKTKRIHVVGTKTVCADRYIPLFPQLEKLFDTMKKQGTFVFPFTENLVKCNFRRLQDNYGFKFRIHDLRHTFATRCLEIGIAMNTVQKWLGHSNPSTTANIYTHVQTKFELEEVAKFSLKMSG